MPTRPKLSSTAFKGTLEVPPPHLPRRLPLGPAWVCATFSPTHLLAPCPFSAVPYLHLCKSPATPWGHSNVLRSLRTSPRGRSAARGWLRGLERVASWPVFEELRSAQAGWAPSSSCIFTAQTPTPVERKANHVPVPESPPVARGPFGRAAKPGVVSPPAPGPSF